MKCCWFCRAIIRIYLLSKSVVIIGGRISCVSTASDKRGLCLSSLGLLLITRFLLLQLLVTCAGKSASNLLDLIAVQLLDQLLGELFKEETIMSLLGVCGDQGREESSHLLKLQLCLGVENCDVCEVDEVRRVVGVGDHSARRVGLSPGADANAAKQVLGMLKVGLLLGAAKSLTALCFRLVVTLFVALGGNTGTLSDVLGDTL